MRRFGIDLGTTNTVIYCAFFPLGGKSKDFKLNSVDIAYKNTGDFVNPLPEKVMPSAIYGRPIYDIPGKEYNFFLGTVAERMAKQDKVPEIINTKRLLCRENPTTKIAYGLTAQDIAQKLLEGCHYSLECASYSERQLKTASYCITQPAAFGLFASRSIQDAAIQAGFKDAEAQREPIAALLSFLYDRLRNQNTAAQLLNKQKAHGNKLLTLVVDIGGGTTDVTIQEIQISGTEDPLPGQDICTGYKVSFLNQVKTDERGEDTPVATANQEPAFGGFDFDKKIAEHIVAEWNKQYVEKTGKNYDWNSKEGVLEISNLYQRVRDYKNNLSEFGEEILQENEDAITIDGQILTCKFNSEIVYGWTQELCESPAGKRENERTVYGIIADTIRRSGYHVSDIDYLYVTGGMSSYRPIRKMLEKRFPELNQRGALIFSKEPLDDIAKGAAVCNCFFAVEMPQTVLYADLMLDDPCGEPSVLVKRNSPLPAEGTIENFMQLRNPAYLYMDVLWGMGSKDCELKRLRRLRKPLPNGKITPIGTDVSVNWEIDAHQAMDIELVVHDPYGEYTIPLLKLIKDIDLSRGDDENG